jgi:serine/threonine protein kinase
MGERSSEKGRDELPTVESLLFAGLVRVRRVDQDPRVVLEGGDASPDLGRPNASQPTASARARYIYQGEIGRGGMGAVHKVLDTDLHRTIAMKIAHRTGDEPDSSDAGGDPSMLERFLEEAQVTGQLDHPGVVPLHEVGIDSAGRVYFTMRFVKGRHLGEIFELARRGEDGWNEERVLIAIIRVCEAMAYAHAKGVVHRDLKPANVMAGRFGEVYVMDWGLAKVRGRAGERGRRPSESNQTVIRTRRTGDKEADAQETTHGTVFGTPAYMSPEQARGEVGSVDARSDLYSIGAILYHFLAGRAPFAAAGEPAKAGSVLERLLAGQHGEAVQPEKRAADLVDDVPERSGVLVEHRLGAQHAVVPLRAGLQVGDRHGDVGDGGHGRGNLHGVPPEAMSIDTDDVRNPTFPRPSPDRPRQRRPRGPAAPARGVAVAAGPVRCGAFDAPAVRSTTTPARNPIATSSRATSAVVTRLRCWGSVQPSSTRSSL